MITIYHNPGCGTSRKVLGMLRDAGLEPEVVEYLKTPPSRDVLVELIARMGVTARDVVRAKGEVYESLGLGDATEAALIDAMVAHPILMNRPIVVSEKGVALCRPAERVLGLLPG